MHNFLILLLTIITFNTAIAQPNHQVFNQLLNKHVDDSGWVDYEGFKSDIKQLDSYLSELSKQTNIDNWSRNEQMAYWINAYNAFTIKAILNNYPLQSITDIKHNGQSIWKHSFFTINGAAYSLDKIENEILRKEFNDPRIHFAINCASISCPPLRNEAFVANKLNQQLEEQSKQFINDQTRNIIQSNNIQVSEIFNWFKTDFTLNTSLIEYLNKYSKTTISKNAKISFLDYNWNLNKLK